ESRPESGTLFPVGATGRSGKTDKKISRRGGTLGSVADHNFWLHQPTWERKARGPHQPNENSPPALDHCSSHQSVSRTAICRREKQKGLPAIVPGVCRACRSGGRVKCVDRENQHRSYYPSASRNR